MYIEAMVLANVANIANSPACSLSFHLPNGVFQRAHILNFYEVQFIIFILL